MKQLAWKGYFALFTCAFLSAIGLTAWGTLTVDSWYEELALWVLALAEVIALYSFTYSRPIGKPWIWTAVLFLSITATVFTSVPLLLDDELRKDWDAFLYGFLLLLALFMIPLWFALLQLARSKEPAPI